MNKKESESFDRNASHMAGEYVAYKDLTDEEIIEQANHLADGWFSDKFEKGIFITEEKLVDLVKTILRKAQEK